MKKRPRVLIIEDEQSIRENLQIFLEKSGFDTIVVSCTTAACPALSKGLCCKEESCADFMLVDLQVPGMDGLTFIETRKERGCLGKDKPTILMTGDLTKDNMDRSWRCGCQFFQKPVPMETVKGWIESRLARANDLKQEHQQA